jgi:hypothetical protein
MAIDTDDKRMNITNLTIGLFGGLTVDNQILNDDIKDLAQLYIGFEYEPPIPSDVALLFGGGLQVTTGIYM